MRKKGNKKKHLDPKRIMELAKEITKIQKYIKFKIRNNKLDPFVRIKEDFAIVFYFNFNSYYRHVSLTLKII